MPAKETVNFTKNFLDKIVIPKGSTRPCYHDSNTVGLSLRVTSNSVKSFFVQKRINKRTTKVTLGRYPEMTIQQARVKAIKTLNLISEGINPNKLAEEESIRKITLGQVFNDYVRSRGTNLKDNTKKAM